MSSSSCPLVRGPQRAGAADHGRGAGHLSGGPAPPGPRGRSLAVARAAVLFINKEAGHAIDNKAEALRKVMAGARRSRRADPKRVRPFLISDFLELAPHMGDNLEDVRDRAMLALGLALGGPPSS